MLAQEKETSFQWLQASEALMSAKNCVSLHRLIKNGQDSHADRPL
jgi:hypothetical protein